MHLLHTVRLQNLHFVPHSPKRVKRVVLQVKHTCNEGKGSCCSNSPRDGGYLELRTDKEGNRSWGGNSHEMLDIKNRETGNEAKGHAVATVQGMVYLELRTDKEGNRLWGGNPHEMLDIKNRETGNEAKGHAVATVQGWWISKSQNWQWRQQVIGWQQSWDAGYQEQGEMALTAKGHAVATVQRWCISQISVKTRVKFQVVTRCHSATVSTSVLVGR